MDSKLSGRFKVTKVLNKTNTKFFKDLKVGDIIYITYNIRQTKLAGYAETLDVSMDDNREECHEFFCTTVSRVFWNCFEFEEL